MPDHVPDHVRRDVRVTGEHAPALQRRQNTRYSQGTNGHARERPRRQVYVDETEYTGHNGFAISVVDSEDDLRASASTSSKQVEKAEEIAIALAIVDQECTRPSEIPDRL